GNAANVSNVGSDTQISVEQQNDGAVGAYAAVAGQGGDTAIATSAAYGNVISGGLCAMCSSDGAPSLNAQSTQTNSGPVSAPTTIVSRGARNIMGSAVAIGNAATYGVNGN